MILSVRVKACRENGESYFEAEHAAHRLKEELRKLIDETESYSVTDINQTFHNVIHVRVEERENRKNG